MKELKILIAAGGSGGHIFPAIALAREFEKNTCTVRIRLVGTAKELDKRIFRKEGFEYSLLSANSMPHSLSLRTPVFFVKLFFDIVRAFYIVAVFRPDAVVGFGGYVSFPIMLVSSFLGIPTIAHEQNVRPGRANLVLFKLADRIAISFDRTREYLGRDAAKAALTGNPIRRDILTNDRPSGIKRLGLDEDKFTILVIGGSQGSHALNETFIGSISDIDRDKRGSLQIIHITGVKDYEWALKAYGALGNIENRVHSFIDRIEEAYSAADLVITRSGASAIFEIALFGKPMILIPYPYAMGHQAGNAKVFSENGAAIWCDERGLTNEKLKGIILGLLDDKERLSKMAESAKSMSIPDASCRLAGEVLAKIKR